MKLQCSDGVWDGDDFTKCFLQTYIQAIIPLATCVFSFVYVVIDYYFFARRPSRSNHRPQAETGPPLHPRWTRKPSSGTIADYSQWQKKPRWMKWRTSRRAGRDNLSVEVVQSTATVELLLLFVLVGINAVAKFTQLWDQRNATLGLIAWVYLIFLACLRPIAGFWALDLACRLRACSLSVYVVQLVLAIVSFRTALLADHRSFGHDLRITTFALTFALVWLMVSTKCITCQKDDEEAHGNTTAPNPELSASILSAATFSWVDCLLWKGKSNLLQLQDVWPVLPKDRAATVLEEFRATAEAGQLTWRLFSRFKGRLGIQMVWALVACVLNFAPPFLIQAILRYLEDPARSSKQLAWLFVVGLAMSSILNAFANGQAMWVGRRTGVHMRAVLMTEVFRKTLKRSATSEDARRTNSNTQTESSPKQENRPQIATKASTGTITNLMAADAYQVGELGACVHDMFPTLPVQLIGSACLLYRLLGRSAVVSIMVMIGLMPLNLIFASLFTKTYKRIMTCADARIKLTNEVMENVKVIKYLAWDTRFRAAIDEKRAAEVKALRLRFLIFMLVRGVWRILPLCIIVLTFLLYTAVEGQPLVPSVAFTALFLFALFRVPLERLADVTSQIQQSRASLQRVELFLQEAETDKPKQLESSVSTRQPVPLVGFKQATFRWAEPDASNPASRNPFRLLDLNVSFRPGLNLIIGPTGSGKTSVLMALLGEMHRLQGSVHLPGGYDRENLKPDPETKLTQSVAYCAQESWLINDTIQQNIIFGSSWDSRRYRAVLMECALLADLNVFPERDRTQVGERGIMLSGGQKQRISLARAVYSNSRYVLLDDCLSAVDSHTAKRIFRYLYGPAMTNRTIIMVTNNESLCVPKSNHVVMVADGRIVAQGSPKELSDRGLVDYSVSSLSSSSSASAEKWPGSLDIDDNGSNAVETAPNTAGGDGRNSFKARTDNDRPNIHTEQRAQGAVSWRVVKLYLTSFGPWYLVMLTPLGFGLDSIAQILVDNWIRVWSNAYAGYVTSRDDPTPVVSTIQYYASTSLPATLNDEIAHTHVNDLWYAGVYVVFAVAYVAVGFLTVGITYTGSLKASLRLHGELIRSVLGAKFKFIDNTPMGQIMSRFSKDLQMIDQQTIHSFLILSMRSASIINIVVLVSLITPIFLAPAAILCVGYGFMGLFYLRTSRDLKRLEAVQRSPIHQQFGETLRGVVTIRAYGEEGRFIRDNESRIDAHTSPFLALWACNRWLAFRFDLAGSLVTFAAAALVINNVHRIDAGAAGLSLTYALSFNEVVRMLVSAYAECEQNMNHVERVGEMLDVEQENLGQELLRPPSWPSRGEVRFQNFSARYREDLGFVLKDLNLTFKGGEKIGIVGRTGAGKSSMALALIRGLEADEGKILIDGIDTRSVSIRDVRESITIVPQDPTVFAGTLRSNLDPFELHTDQEILTVLRRVRLLDSRIDLFNNHTIDTAEESYRPSMPRRRTAESSLRDWTGSIIPVSDPRSPSPISFQDDALEASTDLLYSIASHLSQGQRQLVCLARALLKDSRLLIMDEATASIDHHTDAKLQRTLRELEDTTVVTIAHRLQTIVDYDHVVVLDKGMILEFDHPWNLLRQEDSVFRAMCEKTGRLEELIAMAEIAEGQNALV